MDDGASPTVYSMEEVMRHDTEQDAWIVIEGFVHNITGFLADHPGGKDIVMNYLGKDASAIFVSEAEHAHSLTAYAILARYRIGVTDEAKAIDRTSTEDRIQLSKLVDVTKPILPQISILGPNYNPWLHTQFGLKEIIIFDNFLENFSHYPWYYIFFLWVPFVIYTLQVSYYAAGFVTTMSKFGMGVMFWTVLEYVLHRFVFHLYTTTTNWNKFHFFAHGIHHLTPNDPSRLTFPPLFSIALGVSIYQIVHFIDHSTGVHAFLAGLTLMFMLYDAIHYYFHHGEATWLPEFLKRMKSAHLNHHYKDDTINFGVTTQIMDYLCGTLCSKK